MENEVGVDTLEYNRRMDALDAEVRQKEREDQQREVMALLEQMQPPKTFHMQVAFPTTYLEDADGVGVVGVQKIALGNPTPLWTLMNDHGIHVMQYPPSKNPKVTNIVIGHEWSEVAVEWELE